MGGGSGPPLPGGRVQGGNKMNIINKKIYFLSSANFKSLSQIKGNSVTDCDLKVRNFC